MPPWTESYLVWRQKVECGAATGLRVRHLMSRGSLQWLDNVQRSFTAGLFLERWGEFNKGGPVAFMALLGKPWKALVWAALSHKPTSGCRYIEKQLSQGWSEWAQVGHSSLNLQETLAHWSSLPSFTLSPSQKKKKGHHKDWEKENYHQKSTQM